jgi:pimeloyl-ACP methyl ester carboxylesterase
MSMSMSIEVKRFGEKGERIVCVHGSLSDGDAAFQAQRVFAERYRVVVPNRRGYGKNAPVDHVDVDVDAADIVELMEDGAHLLGTSMGGIVAARAAAKAPKLVRSLTLIEPPAFQNCKDDPVVARVIAALQRHWAVADRKDVRAFLNGFLAALEIRQLGHALPDPLPEPVVKAAKNLMSEAPGQSSIPLEAIAQAPYRKMIVSGDCSEAFEHICDRLAGRWSAARRVFPGAGHAVQRIGEPFNRLLEDFMTGKPTEEPSK